MLEVKLFAQARQLAGSSVVQVPWSDCETVRQLKTALAERHPALGPLMSKLLVAINNDYATDETPIHVLDEVACFPPVSGG